MMSFVVGPTSVKSFDICDLREGDITKRKSVFQSLPLKFVFSGFSVNDVDKPIQYLTQHLKSVAGVKVKGPYRLPNRYGTLIFQHNTDAYRGRIYTREIRVKGLTQEAVNDLIQLSLPGSHVVKVYYEGFENA